MGKANNQSDTRLQQKTVTPTNVQQTITPDDGYTGLAKVIVGAIPKKYIVPTGSHPVTSNGAVNVAAYEFAEVNVQPKLQAKNVSPMTSSQTITADSGYYGLSAVYVNMMPDGYIIPSGNLGINSNGSVDVSGYKTVTVNVEPNLQTKTVTPSTDTQTIKPDGNYDGISKITINPIPEKYIVPSGDIYINQNGKTDVSSATSVTVDVRPNLQTKYITPISTSQRVVADNSYDGIAQVTVGAIPSDYIVPSGSTTITKNGTSNVKSLSEVVVNVRPNLQHKIVTPSSATQHVVSDAGYDGLAQVKIEQIPENYVIPSGTCAITSNGTSDVSSYAKVSVDVTPKLQTKTVIPTTATQKIEADDSHDGLSRVIVNAIPKAYIIPTGTKTITSNGVYDIQNNASVEVDIHPYLQEVTITPDATQKVITPDILYDGFSQITVNAIPSEFNDTSDATATSDDIVVGKTAYINGCKVTGAKAFQTYYTGSDAPSSSLGNDGDIYLQE